jgi:polyisoprenyl-teichoic acid--peptidoglycan teichoic acid transferase
VKKNNGTSRPQSFAPAPGTLPAVSRGNGYGYGNGRGNGRGNGNGRRPPRRHRWYALAPVILGSLIVIVAIVAFIFVKSLLDQIHYVPPEEQTLPSEYNIPTESLVNPPAEMEGITNILLLGVDTRNENIDTVNERSDSMMILTIDKNNKQLKLTSLQRDMLVYLPGKSEPVKINTANAVGGPALALRTVNDTFRLSLSQYMVINMRGMEKLVDIAGGVMIDVDADELPYLNQNVTDENRTFADTPQSPMLTKAGLQRLNGRQAVGYARIRHLDNDYKRMERQRTVLQALLNEFMKTDLTTKGQIVTQGLSLITTNIPAKDLAKIGLDVVPLMNGTIDQMQIPVKGYFTEDSGTTWVNRCDFNGMIPLLQEFIFGKTFSFDAVKVIPGAPHSGIPLPTRSPTKAPTLTPSLAPTTPVTETQATTLATTTLPTETSASTTTSTTSGTTGTTTTPTSTTATPTSTTTAAPTPTAP